MLESFPPIVGKAPRVLVLGSMPGTASLDAGAYYAHPRNLFWPFMGALLGAGPQMPYSARTRRLTVAGVAVWDVLARCERQGSLDSAILDASAQANDFDAFFALHPSIESVLFNGAKAEGSYRRLIVPRPGQDGRSYRRLPSTSPANASQSVDTKLAMWRQAFLDAGLPVIGGDGQTGPPAG